MLTRKARELLERHVLGHESLDARFMQDDYLLTDLLKRHGPEGFVKDMEARVARLASEHRTLPSVCAESWDGPADDALQFLRAFASNLARACEGPVGV